MATPARPPRIAFLGTPRAGKTQLLYAFLKRAGSPDDAHLYPLPDAHARRPEVVPYPIQTGPEAVLTDVDGRAAGELIAHPDRLDGRGTVARNAAGEVRAADAIVLVLEATADGDETRELFGKFADFLDRLEETRAFGREVGGLPVFLTLTKCDRLRQPGDDPAGWLKRVEERKANVRRAFEEFLAAETAATTDPLAFGSVEVHVHATALRFPADPWFESLGDGPFGVDELYEECLAAAAAHRDRAEQSGRRLRWTLAGSGLIVGGMAAALAAFALSPAAGEDRLVARLRRYQDREGPPAVRLADRAFRTNQAELETIRDDPGADRLPADLRAFLDGRLREFAAYKEYRDGFRPPRLGPAEVRSKGELDALAAALDDDLAAPGAYAKAWADTESARLAAKWETDVRLLRQAEAALNDWYRGLIRRATVLSLGPALDAGWRRDVESLLTDADRPPFRPSAEIPGSPKLAVRRGEPLTYAPAFDFDRVDQARFDWRETRGKLAPLRDLADALGLTGTGSAPLDLPEPGTAAASAPLAGDRLRQVAAMVRDPNEWNATRFPDPVRGDLQRRLRRAFDTGVRHARLVVQADLGPDAKASADRLAADPNLAAWGKLLRQLARWADPESPADDPAAELVAFLRRDTFDANLAAFELTLPDDLRDRRVTPAGPLVLTHAAKEYRYRPAGDPKRVGPAVVYRFAADGHDGRLTFRPGDAVSAAVGVRSGDREWRLEWATGRSSAYQFDRLAREPTIVSVPGGAAERAVGVRLSAVPDAGLPRVPALLPDAADR